jgi:PAS domain S-box-containing protein
MKPTMQKKKAVKKKSAGPGKRVNGAPAHRPKRRPGLSVMDMKRLVHELGAHQVELEMQNEELRRTRAELEISRNRYAELYDLSPVGYFTISARGLIREANLTGAEMLGMTRQMLMDKPFSVFIDRDDLAVYQAHRKEVFKRQVRQTCEVRLKPRNAPPLYVRLQSASVENVDNKAGLMRTSVIDITKRRQAEETREKLIVELRGALAKIKTLTGLLPICSWCKKVRNDSGYWEQVDKYLTEHTDVTFTHGMCDECYEKAKKSGLDKLTPK